MKKAHLQDFERLAYELEGLDFTLQAIKKGAIMPPEDAAKRIAALKAEIAATEQAIIVVAYHAGHWRAGRYARQARAKAKQ